MGDAKGDKMLACEEPPFLVYIRQLKQTRTQITKAYRPTQSICHWHNTAQPNKHFIYINGPSVKIRKPKYKGTCGHNGLHKTKQTIKENTTR